MFNTDDKKRINKIVCDLIVRNMENGMHYEQAKKAAFNRMNKECPEVLGEWLELYK